MFREDIFVLTTERADVGQFLVEVSRKRHGRHHERRRPDGQPGCIVRDVFEELTELRGHVGPPVDDAVLRLFVMRII